MNNMENRIEKNEINSEASKIIFDLMQEIDLITANDVENLRRQVKPENLSEFNIIDEDGKIVMALILKMPLEKLREIHKFLRIAQKNKRDQYYFAVHDLSKALQRFVLYVEDPIYKFLGEQI